MTNETHEELSEFKRIALRQKSYLIKMMNNSKDWAHDMLESESIDEDTYEDLVLMNERTIRAVRREIDTYINIVEG